jgi:hypothetical protein
MSGDTLFGSGDSTQNKIGAVELSLSINANYKESNLLDNTGIPRNHGRKYTADENEMLNFADKDVKELCDFIIEFGSWVLDQGLGYGIVAIVEGTVVARA